MSVKQGGIKYHFLSLWYDSSWDWTPVSIPIGEYSTTRLMGRLVIPLNSNFIFEVYNYSVIRDVFPNCEEIVTSPRQGIEMYYRIIFGKL